MIPRWPHRYHDHVSRGQRRRWNKLIRSHAPRRKPPSFCRDDLPRRRPENRGVPPIPFSIAVTISNDYAHHRADKRTWRAVTPREGVEI
ncbi:hypothetical protein KCP74_05810 [Salmonella enterica subsp. enterica]|nr:hypothetical protein KCP74_05810 [Salmonella enterica subsp. enterica]